MTEFIFRCHSGEQALTIINDIADLYIECHSGNPGESDELFSRPSFVARTTSQARQPGFKLVTVAAGGTTAGFSFGYPFPPGKWWAGCTPSSQEFLDSSEFAVIELDVHTAYRRQGLARKLLDELLTGRAEEFATLAATPGSLAHGMYIRWGWRKVGSFADPPVMDAMLIPLNA